MNPSKDPAVAAYETALADGKGHAAAVRLATAAAAAQFPEDPLTRCTEPTVTVPVSKYLALVDAVESVAFLGVTHPHLYNAKLAAALKLLNPE